MNVYPPVNRYPIMRSEVPPVVANKITVLWDLTPCTDVSIKKFCCLHHHGRQGTFIYLDDEGKVL
jgi:hypothetical protein